MAIISAYWSRWPVGGRDLGYEVVANRLDPLLYRPFALRGRTSAVGRNGLFGQELPHLSDR